MHESIERGPGRGRISITTLVLSVVIGITLSLPFKIIKEESLQPLPTESRQELADRILTITEENELMSSELTQIRQRYSDLEETLMQREEASAELAQSRRTYRILAGLDPVHGPGIKLTLSENVPQGSPVGDVGRYIIHQEDLLNIVNELWLAGAEAMAIGSRGKTERLIIDSTIRCVGSLIDINNTRMAPPYEILAIGNPEDLESALDMPGGVLEPLSFYNIQASLEKLDDLMLPAFNGSTLLQYARPVEEGQ